MIPFTYQQHERWASKHEETKLNVVKIEQIELDNKHVKKHLTSNPNSAA